MDYLCSHEGFGKLVPFVHLVCPHYSESIMSGAANAVPKQLSASLTTLEEPMATRELSIDEVLDLVTP